MTVVGKNMGGVNNGEFNRDQYKFKKRMIVFSYKFRRYRSRRTVQEKPFVDLFGLNPTTSMYKPVHVLSKIHSTAPQCLHLVH